MTSLLRTGAMLLLGLLFLGGIPPGEGLPDDALPLPPPLGVTAGDLDTPADEAALRLHAAEAPLLARVSGEPPVLALDPPPRLRAGRPDALGVSASRSVSPTLVSPAGLEERLPLDQGERDAFVLRPRSAGWATWTLHWDGSGEDRPRGSTWTGWAEPERPLRILALSGPPGSEARFALRALEEAGERVEAWIHVGRDLWIGRDGGPLPGDPEAFEDFDVVLLFPGLNLTPENARALLGAVADRGRGLLLAGADGGRSELAAAALGPGGEAGWDRVGGVAADALRWRLPPEVEPLPSTELAVEMRGPTDARPLALEALGRGRIGTLALTDTWRWRMEAGAEAEHRAFWRSLAEWLAGGLTDDPLLEPLGADHRGGDPVRIRWVARGASAAPTSARLRLTDPDGRVTVVDLDRPAETPFGSAAVGAFLPALPGGYRIEPIGDDGETLAPGIGTWVRGPRRGGADAGSDGEGGGELAAGEEAAGNPAPGEEAGGDPATGLGASLDPEGLLARLALASPGGRVGVEATPRPPESAALTDPGRPDLWAAVLLALLAGTFALEWFLRRWSGRP